ncbi:hypothetical protein [Paenibacillus methanolicus]|uniref:Lipoprotein n=1 Tax=Paenibacillus methanolicus TaxID=582686 RepID=A0A5S5CA05_9BACL|nr:hypothetical protein [Paenibacillus methanolicus]TYP74823.1 hypothetical protein BCM02_105370 [Paenibacillus methanolicus]
MRTMIFMLLLGLGFLLTGCSEQPSLLTLKQVEESFDRQGIPLIPSPELAPNSIFRMTLRGVTPEGFSVNGDQLVTVYMLKSAKEVSKAVLEFEDNTAAAGVEDHNRYEAGNVFIFYGAEGIHKDERVDQAIERLRGMLK